ncbi:MAG: UDP-N-acetylglucosamine pyrophosphorylase [Clostridia bacterium]|nr:UDP-N-acetylglucosamine pyrophosphorylase [Clostridia bacterium]
MERQIRTSELLDLRHTLAADYLAGFEYPWQALPGIGEAIRRIGETLPAEEYDHPRPGVWIHKTAEVAPSAWIGESVIIGAGTQVRHGAYIRSAALVGDGAVVGNSAELKNVILFDGVQTPHYNYVGDSILGYKAHMGAGSITSNVKGDKSPVTVRCGQTLLPTGLKKFGAILGDFAEIGCNSVLNPGTVIGRHTQVYPLSMVRGVVPPGSIYKQAGEVVLRRETP